MAGTPLSVNGVFRTTMDKIMSFWPLLIAILCLTTWLVRIEAQVKENERNLGRTDHSMEYIRRQNEAILKDLGVLSGDVKLVRKLLEIRGFRVTREMLED
jgi:hypothetical protein